MKLGVFAVLLGQLPLEKALDYFVENGVEAVEIGCGGYIGNAHCNAGELLKDKVKLDAFRQAVSSRGLEISALSCHGNPLHPNSEEAKRFHADFQNAVRLAAELGVQNVVTFAGCPGESETSQYPVWVTCPWPEDFSKVVNWQWETKVIPYWLEQNTFLKENGVRVAIEPHPGFVVYNSETSLRLREMCGEHIGVNFDPSHLFWQQMDPVACIKELAEANALYHFHAKDTAIYSDNTSINGVLDTKSYRDTKHRSWIFRTVGYGHGEDIWRDIVSALQLVGYEGAISIEHEDGLMSVNEGFQKAAEFLKPLIIKERVGDMWWA